jgi:GxxExxY protein
MSFDYIEVCQEYRNLFTIIELICKRIHSELGGGYQEAIYQNALCVELGDRYIPYQKEVTMDVIYNKRKIGSIRADIICYGDYPLIIETKTTRGLGLKDRLQLGRYMKTQDISYGVLVNFLLVGPPEIEFLLLMDEHIIKYNSHTQSGVSVSEV